MAIQQDLPVVDIVEACDQAGDGRFTRPGASHQRHGFPFRDIEIDIAQRGHFATRVGKGDVLELEIAFRPLNDPRTFVFFLLGIEDRKQRLARRHPALELGIDVGQRLQRTHQRNHRGEDHGNGPGGQGVHHAREAGGIQDKGQRQGGDKLNDRVGDRRGGNHLHPLQTHFIADFIKTFGFHFLAAKHQHLFVPFQHLLGAGGDLPHRVLHILTDIAKTLGDHADRHRHNRRQYDQDQRQLPAVIEHHHEQTDNRCSFADHGDQRAGRRGGDLLRIIGDA